MSFTILIPYAIVLILGAWVIWPGQDAHSKRWAIRSMCAYIGFLSFIIFLIGPRLAMRLVESDGLTWVSEMAVGSRAMNKINWYVGGILLIAIGFLATLASQKSSE